MTDIERKYDCYFCGLPGKQRRIQVLLHKTEWLVSCDDCVPRMKEEVEDIRQHLLRRK